MFRSVTLFLSRVTHVFQMWSFFWAVWPLFAVWPILPIVTYVSQCDSFFQTWLIFHSVIHFSKSDLLFEMWPFCHRVTHFPNVIHFSHSLTQFLKWPTFLKFLYISQCKTFLTLWNIFIRYDLILPVWPTFFQWQFFFWKCVPCVTRWHKCDPYIFHCVNRFFQMWPIFHSVSHFNKCDKIFHSVKHFRKLTHFLSNVTSFLQFDPFFKFREYKIIFTPPQD